MKIGDWVQFKTIPDGIPMLVIGDISPQDDLGFYIESVRVFWLDGNNVPYEKTLPVCAFEPWNT